MAIEVNKRKRTFAITCGGDGTDEKDDEIPCKKSKKVKKVKSKSHEKPDGHRTIESLMNGDGISDEHDYKEKLQEEEEEDVFVAEGTTIGCNSAEIEDKGKECFHEEEPQIKFSKDFKMLHFRAVLRGRNFITELRQFLHLAQKRPQIVSKYIEKRGKPLELVEALERIDKSSLMHVSYLCQALHLVLMEILSNQSKHLESAVHACRYFLKAHTGVLESLLKSQNVQHRRIALKLMTAVVCSEPQLGRQLLCSYDILSNVHSIENFLSHNRHELNSEETVRRCFIHFILAYLVDGNILLIRNILDRGTFIRALVSDMLYDDHVTVCVILNTLRKYVLECTDISKTKKIHVFDLECCKKLVRLYDWHGPKVYANKIHKSSGNKAIKLSQQEIDELVDPHEREAVAKALHEFLLTLLSSRKYGIAFDAMTHFRQKHNVIQGKTIGFLYKPWCSPRKTELITKILEACPDLARHTMRHFSGIANPIRTPQRDWPLAYDFLTKLIATLHPRLLKNAIDKITLTDFSYWIKDICLPLEVLVHITGSNTLKHNSYDVRIATNRLLLAMFRQYSNFMSVITKREQLKSGNNVGASSNSLRRFKFDILNHILVHFPTMENIAYSLYMSIQNQNEQNVDVLEHLEITLDLILIICKENRSFIDRTGVILDYLKLLRPLYANDDEMPPSDQGIKKIIAMSDDTKKGNINIELKAIKAILLLFPKALEPHQELFSSVLKSFIKAFTSGSGEVQREAGELLHGIFKNTGLFDAGELEIDLWLEALRFFDKDDNILDVVTRVLIEVLQVTKANVDTPKSTLESNIKNSNLQKLFQNIEQGLSVQAYIETLSFSKLMPLIFKGVEIVAPLNLYLETVCLLMFHYYPEPEDIYHLYTMQFTELENYMSSWLRTNDAGEDLPKLENCLVAKSLPDKLQQLHALILKSDSEKKFEDFFAANTEANDSRDDGESGLVEIRCDSGQIKRLSSILSNTKMLLIYSQTILFMVTQLVKKQKLTQKQAELAASYLKGFIAVACELQQREQQESNDNLTYSGHIKINEQTSNSSSTSTTDGSLLMQLLKYIFTIRINYIENIEIFNPTHDTHLHYLQFLSILAEGSNKLENFAHYTTNYRLRLVKAVAISVKQPDIFQQQSQKSAALNAVLGRLIQAFNLDTENCVEILNLLATNLKSKHFFYTAGSGDQKRTIYYELLVLIVQRLADLKTSINCDTFLQRFVKLYIQFVRKLSADAHLESLEQAMHQFLHISHQYVSQLNEKFFETLFFDGRKIHKSTIRLACLLLECNLNLKEKFLELLPLNVGKKEIIYPLLKIAFQQGYPIESSLLQTIYQEFKNGFIKTIEKPQKAGVIYRENVECSIALIERCMPRSECIDFSNKNLKIDAVELYQIRLIDAIYKKALGNSNSTELTSSLSSSQVKQFHSIFVNYINLLLQILLVELKKQSIDQEKLELIAFSLYEWLLKKPSLDSGNDDLPDFSRIVKSQQWMNFCRSALKLGMFCNTEKNNYEEEVEDLRCMDINRGLLLKLLAFLCDQLYPDYKEEVEGGRGESEKEEFAEQPSQLFDMIFTHSKFFPIVLQHNSGTPTLVKTQVLHLLYVLARKSPIKSLNSSQIPVILGAYEARLYDADRYALALLRLYERYECNLHKYRPFIWGESATAFYALRAVDASERSRLAQQETSVAQVMSLIDRQICEYTLDNFPIWRRLETEEQMPDVRFYNPARKAFSFGSNTLEQSIEEGLELQTAQEFSIEELRLCPKRATIYEACYDPAFLIPLMNMCFAPESYAHPARPVQNGLLSLVFAALSSMDRSMRLAAGSAQLRYRAHFESHKFFERPLWIQAYENIQAGLSDLRDNWMKHKRNSGTPRASYIPALFIAKAFNLTTDPTHLLYKPLTMYLRLKSSFDFQCIPEFNVLFYSSEMEHQIFRQFIVEIIRSGIKCSSDLYLLVSTHTFKVLLGFYGSPMSTLDMNLLILSVMSTCVKIPASSKIMIEHVGILPWLRSITGSLEFYHFDIIEGLISIISNLWYALKAASSEFHNYQHICAELHGIALCLLPHISPRISVERLAKLLNILTKTAQPHFYRAVTANQLNLLIECFRKHFPELIYTVDNIRLFGNDGAESTKKYCQRLYDDYKLNSVAIMALSSLRDYTGNWWQCVVDGQSQKMSICQDVMESDLNETVGD